MYFSTDYKFDAEHDTPISLDQNGSDQYLLNLSDGQDVINDDNYGYSGVDVLRFGVGTDRLKPVATGRNRPEAASCDRLQTVSNSLLGHGRVQLRVDDLQPSKLESSNKITTQSTIEIKKYPTLAPIINNLLSHIALNT